MKPMHKRILISLVIGVLLVIVFYSVTNAITRHTGYSVSSQEEVFGRCLSEKDITLYVNTRDIAETLKKIQTYQYLEKIKIKNCFINNEECISREITAFPTWIIENKKIERDISLQELADYSYCSVTK